MTASEARWKAYCVRHPEVEKEYERVMGQVKNFVKMGKNALVMRIVPDMVIGKMRKEGYTVVVDDNGMSIISW